MFSSGLNRLSLQQILPAESLGLNSPSNSGQKVTEDSAVPDPVPSRVSPAARKPKCCDYSLSTLSCTNPNELSRSMFAPPLQSGIIVTSPARSFLATVPAIQ